MNDNFLLAFLKKYEESNPNHNTFLDFLNDIYEKLPESIRWEITDIWRGKRTGKSPAKLSNFIKYFNNDKSNHLKTTQSVVDNLLLHYPEDVSKAISILKNLENNLNVENKNNLNIENKNNVSLTLNKLSKENLPYLIKKYIEEKGFPLYKNKQEYTICYVENLDIFGNTDKSNPNHFNDIRLVLEFYDTPKIIGMWEATTAPGLYYTNQPMNPAGVFKIIPGWHNQCWQIGTHRSPDHPALVQTGNAVKGYRDKNKDFNYSNDSIVSGYFGINQHHGYNMSSINIGKTSAGCLVGRTINGHFEFMNIIKNDIRYLNNKNYRFSTLIIPSTELEKI